MNAERLYCIYCHNIIVGKKDKQRNYNRTKKNKQSQNQKRTKKNQLRNLKIGAIAINILSRNFI